MAARGESSRVTVYAKSTAVSVTPVKPGKIYPLSVLDHAMARHTLHLVFYFRPGPTMDREKLKDSLSDMLSHYPVMTGRLSPAAEEEGGGSGGWVVKCNDAGVRVLDARVRATLDGWLATATAEEEKELAYWEPMGANISIWSPYYIQITEFEDKGFAIGLSCPHIHADPTCAILLIKGWGDSHRRAYIATPPFFHPPALVPRSSPNTSTPSAALLSAKSSSSSAADATKMSSATFRFSDKSVQACLDELRPACPDVTPFDALSSLFWRRIAAAGGGGAAALTLCVDFRKLMHAPLPHGFYGNALHFSKVTAEDILGAGWGGAARAVREHLAGTTEEEYWSAVDWLGSRPRGEAFQMYGPELTCAALDGVFAYAAAFEKGEAGRPAHVSCRVGGVEGEGLVMVLPAPDEGAAARTVAVTLPEEVMERICKDEEILKHEPTVMLSGKVV